MPAPLSAPSSFAARRVQHFGAVGLLSLLTACGSGFGLQKIDETLIVEDTAGLTIGGSSGEEGGSGSGEEGSVDTGLTGGGSSGSGSSGSGSSGGESSGSGSSGSGSSGGESSGSGSSGSGSSGSGSGGSGSSGSGSSGSGSSGSGSTDADGDGYDAASDCDDGDASVHPGATEICDGVDNDCDGLVDGDDASLSGGTTGYWDGDGDGYGDPTSTASICREGGGYVFTPGDCDDANARVNPGATEVCDDLLDNDCSGAVDDSPSCAMSLSGGFLILYGYNQFYPGSYNCDLYWSISGTEDTTICPTCDFAFDISARYESTASYTDGSCTGMGNFNTVWAYDSNYYPGTPYFLEYSGGSWYPITSNVVYDASSGYWAWGAGVLDYPYYYWFSTYYYTYYQVMVAYTY